MPRFPKPNVRRNARALQGALKRRIPIRRIRSVISPADVLTLANAFSGFLAIAVLTDVARLYERPFFPGLDTIWPAVKDDRFLVASILMGFGLVMDALDGNVARRFGGSRLGGDLDTLADTITFVVTPSLFVLTYYGQAAPFPAFLAASLILVMGILRLARFNANPTESETKTFQGLPTPWMAITIALMVLTDAVPYRIGTAFAALLAFLMMSNVAYPKSKGRTRYATYLMVVSALVIIGVLIFFPQNQPRIIGAAFTLTALTIAIAPLLLLRRSRKENRLAAARGPPLPSAETGAGPESDSPWAPRDSGGSAGAGAKFGD